MIVVTFNDFPPSVAVVKEAHILVQVNNDYNNVVNVIKNGYNGQIGLQNRSVVNNWIEKAMAYNEKHVEWTVCVY